MTWGSIENMQCGNATSLLMIACPNSDEAGSNIDENLSRKSLFITNDCDVNITNLQEQVSDHQVNSAVDAMESAQCCDPLVILWYPLH